ncbi:MAG: glycosyltransferase family 4 protein [Bacteroidales bacterium]|nr:glycosyltransferase family 4 protein [Bacteroidales bacterium]
MKILHVIDGSIYNYDGVSTYINELLECAHKGGEKLMVFSSMPLIPEKRRLVIHKVEVKEFKNLEIFSSDQFNFSLPGGMKKALNKFKPDIIWIHTIGPLGLRAAHLAKNKYPVIYTKHCFDGDLWCNHLKIPVGFQWFFQLVAIFVERTVLKHSDVAFYHLNNTEKIRSNKFFSKFKYVPPPINERFVNEKSYRNGDHNNDILTIGFCGRLEPEKSIEQLFKAADIYQKKYNKNNIRLLLIGGGSEAGTLVSQYPHVNTTITGFVDDVIPYLDQLDAYVLASKTEMYSLSSLEAYSRGLPVFSTPVGYLGQNADKFRHIYNFNTAEELASLINEVLNVKKISVKPLPVDLEASIITFSKLHEMVASEYL